MKRTLQKVLMLSAVLAMVWAPSAWAACTLDSQPVWHGFGGWFSGCADANPVSGYIYLLSSPATVNSGTQGSGNPGFVCNQGGVLNNILQTCQDAAGTAGDGNVTVFYDFGVGNPGAVGCPNPTAAGTGVQPLGIQVLCNDGASIFMTLGFDEAVSQYLMEYAMPADGSPVQAGYQNGPAITSVGAGPSPSASTVCVHVPPPTVRSDCEAGTLGEGYTCPDPSARPLITAGQLYIREAVCGSTPDPRTASGWVPTAVPLVNGDACNVITQPTIPGNCAFLGATALVGGIETPALTGWLQVQNAAAAGDKVKIDKAGFAQGKLLVDFSTTNETSIVGFNVYSGATKLNGNLITAKGAGSNAYSFEVGRGALKGGKSVLVEAVKSNGSVEKTAPVTLK